jgi:hypothetical protein
VTADDGRNDGGQLGGHGDDTFPVALRRGDHKQGDDLAVGPLVLPGAEMGEFKSFFYASTRVPQNLNDRPLPEGGVFGMRDVDVLADLQVESADVRWSSEPDAAFIHPAPPRPVGAAPDSDRVSAGCARDLGEELTDVAVPVLHVFHEGAQHRLSLPGAVVHAFLDTSFAVPAAADIGVGDRARRHPHRPLPGFRGGPRLQIGIEGADRSQDGIKVAAAVAVGADRDLLTPPLVELAVDAQVGLARGDPLDCRPEVAGQVPGQVVQRRVVQLGFASFQVSDEQVPDPAWRIL